MKHLFILTYILAGISLNSQAQYTFTCLDINPTGHSYPGQMAEYNGKLYFGANNGTNGHELFVTDGTTAGTQLLKDIVPGVNSSGPTYLKSYNGKLLFAATTPTEGREIWTSDGTEAGTQLLKDIRPGSDNSVTSVFHEFNGKLYFWVNEDFPIEPYYTDGTATGTDKLKDLNNSTNVAHTQKDFYELNGKLIFQSFNNINGVELHVSDGTAAGTQLLKDIYPGTDGGAGRMLGIYNGKLYFNANDGVNGIELWETDGTTAGTKMLKDINPGGDSNPGTMVVFKGKMYFSASDGVNGHELWVSDGTAAGTQLLKNINPGTSGSSALYDLAIEYNGELYFNAITTADGSKLWATDGTTAGTRMLDILPAGGNSPSRAIIYNNKLLFRVYYGSGMGSQVTVSDGTAAGTKILQPDIAPNPSPLISTQWVIYNNSVYISADYDNKGTELWKLTDNTVSVPEAAPKNSLSIYPNPTDGQVTITLQHPTAEAGIIQVYDAMGRVIYTRIAEASTSSFILLLPALPQGAYYVKLQAGTTTLTEQLISR